MIIRASYTNTNNVNWSYETRLIKAGNYADKRFFVGYGITTFSNYAFYTVSSDGNTINFVSMFVDNNDVTNATTVEYFYR